MKKVMCISKKEKSIKGWAKYFRLFGVYSVVKEASDYYLLAGSKSQFVEDWYTDKTAFIPMKMVLSAVAFFLVLFLAMVGESLINQILKFML